MKSSYFDPHGNSVLAWNKFYHHAKVYEKKGDCNRYLLAWALGPAVALDGKIEALPVLYAAPRVSRSLKRNARTSGEAIAQTIVFVSVMRVGI